MSVHACYDLYVRVRVLPVVRGARAQRSHADCVVMCIEALDTAMVFMRSMRLRVRLVGYTGVRLDTGEE